MLPRSFPSDWSSGGAVTWFPGDNTKQHPPRDWLESVWKYLIKNCPDDLSRLQDLPLIPINWSEDIVTLARLRYPSVLVLQSSLGDRLDVDVARVLTGVGITVLNELPAFVTSHPAVLGNYIHPPSISSVLQVMVTLSSVVGYATIFKHLQCQSPSDKQRLRDFIAKASVLSPKERELVRNLPLFETLEGSGSKPSRFVSAQELSVTAPRKRLPVKVFQELIDINQGNFKSLARLIGLTMLKTTDLLSQIVFQDVRNGNYSGNDVDKVMGHVFNHFQEYNQEMPGFQNILKTIPFVTKRDGQRVKPSDLFDPRVSSLQDILAGEDAFPFGPVYTDPTALVILSELGLKSDLTATDVVRSVSLIENMAPSETAQRKAHAVLHYLNGNMQKMSEKVSGQTLGICLRGLRWIPSMTTRPSSYPRHLPFPSLDGACFYKPTEVKTSRFVDMIGSVKPVVQIDETSSSKIADFFHWSKEPDTRDVIEHLKRVVECYTETEKPTYMIIVKKIYQHFLALDPNALTNALPLLHGQTWIWNGDGFSSSCEMVLEKPFIDLSPYICPLPSEIAEFKGLFKAGGMTVERKRPLLLRVLEMMKENYDKGQRFERAKVKRDLQLAIDILNELKPSSGEFLDTEVKERLLIPTNVQDDSTLRLAPIQECTYCDAEWLKQGHDVSDVDEDGDISILYVHRNIPNDTAEILGVPTLMSRMLDAEELEVGEEFGQEEPLTRSIHRLLEGYTDGFAVPKELIQNADDAGATEVKFLYDERTNEDAMTCLFDEGMKACQGPALWAYNNAVFTDEDFTNITKLNGATKEKDTDKIGRFGSGFNAVYNLTDVPSFVSRNSFVIFDPHTTHLGKAIRNNRPGLRINMKNRKKLRKLANQFKPFNGIFGCDLRPEAEQDSYDATLFRFPLRTKEQAAKSELKDLHYTDQEMRELLKKFVQGAESLLLFTQTVRQVSVYHLPKGSSGTPQPCKLFEVTKSAAKVIREVTLSFPLPPTVAKLSGREQYFAKQCSFLRASSQALKTMGSSANFPRSSMVIHIEIKHTETGTQFFGVKDVKSNSRTWLVSSTMGSTSALQFAKEDKTKSLVPAAGVAVRLAQKYPGKFLPEPIVEPQDNSRHNGQVFCYLPLPIHSGLPVHVNGFFAVASDRRHLKERTEDDKYHLRVDWNDVLMKDAVSNAYISSLEDLKSLDSGQQGSCDNYDLWPRTEQVSSDSKCQPIVKSFYSCLAAEGPNSPKLFSDGNKWASIDEVVFLDPDLRGHQKIGDIAFQVFKECMTGSKVVIDLPRGIVESFKQCGYGEAIEKRTFSTKRFYREVFLPNITSTPPVRRDPLTLYAIDEDNLRTLLMEVPCIPASPEGQKLKRPRELVHPHGEASSLYMPEDEKFPHGTKETFQSVARLEKLTEELGMLKDDLSWKDVIERAQSVKNLNLTNHDGALKRTRALIGFLNKKLTREENQAPAQNIRESFWKTEFLPILSKPKAFPLRWKGDDYGRHVLLAPRDVFLKRVKNLVSCTQPILNDYQDGCGEVPRKVKVLLGFEEKEICLDDVKAQLETAISSKCDLENVGIYDEMKRLLHSVYEYLQEHLDQKREEIISFLAERKFILGKRHFLSVKQVAFKFHRDCPPYLHELPQDINLKFHKLMCDVGVRESFDVVDYVSSLQMLKDRFGNDVLDNENLNISVHLASLIDSWRRGDTLSIQSSVGVIYLPDTECRLYPSSELCIKDCHWMPYEEGVTYAHPKIPPETCVHLGVNTRRQETLRKCSRGISFGQREKLTNRLKRILQAYPCEKEILKELLQNADDAQATELCFIKDPRQHGEERVFEDSWKPLQGPALCVYNNKPFTNADIEGIQNLGEGSKGDDPNKTGQYGVGFNAVYHLTDAPSFLSKGSEIGEVLCVFDPQCKFVPDATLHEPGRMFSDIDKLRGTFTDVFPCYLGEHFPVDNATMFRFPLRNEKMAKESNISTTPMTVDDLDAMMNKFKLEMFDALLFVNTVKKMSLCEVAEDGKLTNHYEVTAELSEEDVRKRTEFSDYVTFVGSQLRRKEVLLSELGTKEVSYIVRLEDTTGYHEEWLIVQRIGFEPGMHIPESVSSAFHTGDLSLLPRGGVASLLKRSSSNRKTSKPKAFCFLPLPFETGLPVHVNGHFALDHEARRNLWRDDGGGYRSDWNNTLLRWVIAPCYVTLLATVRAHLQLPVGPDGITLLGCEAPVAQTHIASYLRLFPSLHLEEAYWVTLSKGVYQYVNKKRVRLLPVLRSVTSTDHAENVPSSSSKESRGSEITWLPTNGEGKDRAFFNSLKEVSSPKSSILGMARRFPLVNEREKRLKAILLDAGLNVIESPLDLYFNFTASDVPVSCLSPHDVLTFFKSYSSCQPLCCLGNLPQPVQHTPLKDVSSVVLLLKYCKEDESFVKSLQGVPLLVTQDEILTVFDCSSPPFLTDHVDLLPQCASEFVHRSLYIEVFHEVNSDRQSVFKVFDINALASHLHRTLPAPEFCTVNRYVKWSPLNEQEFPCKLWIMQVWKFLAKETKSIHQKKDSDAAEKSRQIEAKLTPLNDWCLLPATEKDKDPFGRFTTSRHYLVPVSMADTILHFEGGYLVASLKEALRDLSLPELNCHIIDGSSLVLSYSEPAKMLVATLSNPSQVLCSLHRKLKCSSLKVQCVQIQQMQFERILRYFSEHTHYLRKEDEEILRMLPFYLTVHDDSIDLIGKTVYVLPETIPKQGMNVWQTRTRTVFLKENPSLSKLHEFLHTKSCTEIDLYCDYIFKHFEDMSPEDRLAHLEYLHESRLPVLKEPDRGRLLACLRDLPFLRAENGSLQTASCFYDPEEPVFKAMLPCSAFPPEPFSLPRKWLPFLRQVGLVQKVTMEHFVHFAEQVASEARFFGNGGTQAKSQVLLKHLFQRPNVATEGLLEKIRHIPFIHPWKVSERLSRVYPQFGMTQNGKLPYICFEGAVLQNHDHVVWTSAILLPASADPTKYPSYLFQINYPAKSSLAHYKNYREEIIRRLGILQEPTTEDVVSHCENVCFHWAKENNTDNTIKRDVLTAVYIFLQRHLHDVAKSRLQHVPCILVENGRLVLPCQIVIDFMSEHEIKPYLYKAPAELGTFHKLFMFLGGTRNVTVEQYAMVLMEIYKKVDDDKLGPNETLTSLKAVKGLFEKLEDAKERDIEVSILYLPGAKKEEPSRVFMRSSTELVFDNAPQFRDRIIGFDEMLLVDLEQCGLKATNFEGLVKMLPQKFRPRMLTSLVQESLAEPVGESPLQGRAEEVRKLLTSQQFSHAIVRLIRHEDVKEGRKTDSDILTSVKQWLSGIRVHGIEVLKTHLLYRGKEIPESTREKRCFAEKIGENTQVKWNIYLETSGGHEKTWISRVAEIVNEITGGLLKNSLVHLSQLLMFTPGEMWPFLDELGIREDQTYDFDQTPCLPTPGTFIHTEDHHLLKDAFEDFEPGEYVGYELGDPSLESEDDVPTYIYATIIEEELEGAQAVSFWKKRYRINIGNDQEPIVVDAVDLYKFRRVKGAPSMELVVYDGDEAASASSTSRSQPKNLEEAMDEITELLEEAWKLPKQKRDKIIKRVYLTWHPDKNPGNEEFSTEVFQYLQREIARLERGEPRRPRAEARRLGFKHENYYGGYSSFFTNWNRRAGRHRSQYDHFQENYARSRSYRANPQPGEARRWFRQAQADLKAAGNDFSGAQPSYEWVCFKCHQVRSITCSFCITSLCSPSLSSSFWAPIVWFTALIQALRASKYYRALYMFI